MAYANIQGAQKVIDNFKALPVKVQEELKDIVYTTTLRIHQDAQNNAPNANEMLATTYGYQKNETQISQYIDYRFENGGMTGVVSIDAEASLFSIYTELGTGSSAAGYIPTLPAKWQRIARLFYINGLGTLIKHPFLLPAFFKNEKDYIRQIKTMLRRVVK